MSPESERWFAHKHAPKDLNPDQLVWNQSCCHYTRGAYCFIESAQWESNPHIRHGKAVGCRYIMGAGRHPVLIIEEHREGIEPSLPHYECGVLPLDHQCLFVAIDVAT